MARSGLFITFEGSEGCGKSTQIGLLTEELRLRGVEPVVLREPGGTSAGEVIRSLLKHAPEGAALTPEAELLLFAASRAQLVREIIRPALDAGKIVLCDRFMDSTTVYQGVARKIAEGAVAAINAFAVGDCRPDLTFLFDLDRDIALQRMEARGHSRDRIERESEDFFASVRSGYLAIAAREPGRIRVLDAAKSPEVLAGEISETLRSLKP